MAEGLLCPATRVRLPRLFYVAITVPMRQTRQAVRAIKQPIYLDVFEWYQQNLKSYGGSPTQVLSSPNAA
jgi:hypothetical protein